MVGFKTCLCGVQCENQIQTIRTKYHKDLITQSLSSEENCTETSVSIKRSLSKVINVIFLHFPRRRDNSVTDHYAGSFFIKVTGELLYVTRLLFLLVHCEILFCGDL